MIDIRKILKIKWIIPKVAKISGLTPKTIYKIRNWEVTYFETRIKVFEALKKIWVIPKDLLYNDLFFEIKKKCMIVQ